MPELPEVEALAVFLREHADLQLNLPSRTVRNLESDIRLKRFHPAMFDRALAEVVQLMWTDTYPRFIRGKNKDWRKEIAFWKAAGVTHVTAHTTYVSDHHTRIAGSSAADHLAAADHDGCLFGDDGVVHAYAPFQRPVQAASTHSAVLPNHACTPRIAGR